MRFSERKGFIEVDKVIQKDFISNKLRNRIWNFLEIKILKPTSKNTWIPINNCKIEYSYLITVWDQYFGKSIDEINHVNKNDVIDFLKTYYFNCDWYEVYDFVEFTLNLFNRKEFIEEMNCIFEECLSGYRFVSGYITNITDKEELETIQRVLSDDDFPGPRNHIKSALKHYSNRESPDYRNSIKESISAVESMASIITGKSKSTLGEALKELERNKTIHPFLKEGFSKLYGYTSDADGIRHKMLDEPNLGAEDAYYFLVSCSCFVNYLKQKWK